jgi:hypothetical protein
LDLKRKITMSEEFSNLALAIGSLILTPILNVREDKFAFLTYLRHRADSMERERQEWLAKLNWIRVKQDTTHKQAWELRTRQSEVGELQKQLDEAQLVLYNERSELVRLARENDRLKT